MRLKRLGAFHVRHPTGGCVHLSCVAASLMFLLLNWIPATLCWPGDSAACKIDAVPQSWVLLSSFGCCSLGFKLFYASIKSSFWTSSSACCRSPSSVEVIVTAVLMGKYSTTGQSTLHAEVGTICTSMPTATLQVGTSDETVKPWELTQKDWCCKSTVRSLSVSP